MRVFLLFVIFIFAATVFAQSQQPQSKSRGPQQSSKADQRGTEKAPLIVKLAPSPNADAEAVAQATERKEKLDLDRQLVHYTDNLGIVTAILAAIGVLQLFVFGIQAWQLKRTVDSSEDANAPYVFPDLVDVFLLVKSAGHKPVLAIKLWNHGKTPAIMKRARFELHISDVIIGHPQFTEKVTEFSSNEVISGEQPSHFNWNYVFHRTLTDVEIQQLSKRIEDPPYLRFYLTGEIAYTDFFGYTHTVGCCFKLFANSTYLIKAYPGYAYRRKNKTAEAQPKEQDYEATAN